MAWASRSWRDEVRKLAEKSAQSTKEISELIGSIQKEARKAVDNMEKSTTIVNEGLNLGQELNAALRKISNVVTEVYKFAQEIGAATNEQSHGSSQIARATTRLNEITHEINSAVEEQACGAQAVVQAMERMRELVQASTSSSTELAASSDQMSKMSRGLLGSMDRFGLRTSDGAGDHMSDRTRRERHTNDRNDRNKQPDERQNRPSGKRQQSRVWESRPGGEPHVEECIRAMSRETHVVGFRVGRETYGVPIASLREIVRVPEITAVPDAPDYLEGIINLRGRIISVVDLRKAIRAGCHRNRPAQPHSGRGTPGTAGRHDRRLGIGGSENPRERNRSRACHDAGRRSGLRDGPGKVSGKADPAPGHREGIRGGQPAQRTLYRKDAGKRLRWPLHPFQPAPWGVPART
jgi:hypothetical protein